MHFSGLNRFLIAKDSVLIKNIGQAFIIYQGRQGLFCVLKVKSQPINRQRERIKSLPLAFEAKRHAIVTQHSGIEVFDYLFYTEMF